jgi:hypothetical protein
VDTFADTLWGWVDSEWEADINSRRSYTGYLIMFNGVAVSWKSRRQDCVSLSTSEAKYVAASQCGQEVYCMREILRDIEFAQTAPAQIYEDNLACVVMSENPVQRKVVRLRTHLMVADALQELTVSSAY